MYKDHIDEKLALSQKLINENKIVEGIELLEELLEESNELRVILAAMSGETFMAWVCLDMGGYDSAIRYADKAINLAVRLSQVDEVMEKYNDTIISDYRSAYRYKGQAIFEKDMSNCECLEALEEATQYNENEALYYLGLYYVVNNCSPSDDYKKFCSYSAKQAEYHEKYVENLEGNEDPERIRRICNSLATLYENGIGVPENKLKAQYYKDMIS